MVWVVDGRLPGMMRETVGCLQASSERIPEAAATLRRAEAGAFGGPVLLIIWGFPTIRGPIFGSPYNKSPTILGYILGPLILPDFWSLPYTSCII